jgi:hypothetical protein
VAVALLTTSVGRGPVTVTPPTGELALGAEKVTGVDGGWVAPRCVTVTGDPPIVMVPVRSAVAVFAATVKFTVPLPVPLAPWLMVMNADPLTAVHAHVDAVVTATVPVPPSGGNAATLGCPTLKVQVVEGFVGVDLSLHAAATKAVATNPHRKISCLIWYNMRNKIHREKRKEP